MSLPPAARGLPLFVKGERVPIVGMAKFSTEDREAIREAWVELQYGFKSAARALEGEQDAYARALGTPVPDPANFVNGLAIARDAVIKAQADVEITRYEPARKIRRAGRLGGAFAETSVPHVGHSSIGSPGKALGAPPRGRKLARASSTLGDTAES